LTAGADWKPSGARWPAERLGSRGFEFGDPEVAQKRITIFVEEYVRWFDVAVQIAPGVNKIERLRDVRQPILERVERLVAKTGSRSLHSPSQTAAREKLHDRERLPSLFTEIDDLDDMRVA
jgi:hypothetical protein